jgi:pre-peptidase
MMHSKLRWVMFAAALGLGVGACKGDPTASLRNGVNSVTSSPSFLTLRALDLVHVPPIQDSAFIVIEGLDEQGNRLSGDFSATTTDPGVTVTRDLTFTPVYDGDSLVPPKTALRARFNVKVIGGPSCGIVTASIGGKHVDVPVAVFQDPATSGSGNGVTGATVSTGTPALGDTVFVTAPAPYHFVPATTATGDGPVAAVGISADSTQLKVLVGAGQTSALTLSPVVLSCAPTQVTTFSLTTTGTVTAPAVPNSSISPIAPALGVPVTITAPAGYVFTSSSTVSIPGAAGVVTGLSADSTQLTFLPGPNANGPVTADVIIESAPEVGSLSTVSTETLTTPAVLGFTATLSTANPALQDTVTITADPPLRFLPTATLRMGSAGGVVAIPLSVSTDSTTLSFIAPPGQPTATLYGDGMVLSFLPAVTLNGLQSNVAITPAAGFAGTGALATAPTLALPASGATITYVDVGTRNTVAECTANDFGAPCRVYKINVAAAGDLDFSETWEGTTDGGVYVLDAAGTTLIGACDGAGNGGGGPEACTITFPSAGTYFVTLADFGPFYPEPVPAWIRLDITAP